MLHKDAVTSKLFDTALALTALPELSSFRMVGGTAIALQIGHRQSVDIDFFSVEKVNKRIIVEALRKVFPASEYYITQYNIQSTINEVRIELYDDWHTPFLDNPVVQDGLRLASLKDLAAFKFDTIVERREKKDYIDLYFLFKHLGAQSVLEEFKTYNPHLSAKSVLFALGEVNVARENKSVMPEMLASISWEEVERSMISAAKLYLSIVSQQKKSKG